MMSQYPHNQYMLNPAFGGSREVLSLYGSYRYQWVGAPFPPTFQVFTAHAPLKNENVALGGLVYSEQFGNQEFGVYQGTKINMSYTYRIITASENKIAFSLNPGVKFSNYGKLDVDFEQQDDDVLNELGILESDPRFGLGFGLSWYGNNFFFGISFFDFFYRTPFDPDAAFFTIGRTPILITGGYLFHVSEIFKFQPSALVNIVSDKITIKDKPDSKYFTSVADISLTGIIADMLWVGFTYRTNKEVIGMAGWQIIPQMRATFSYDFPTGDLKKFNAGSLEVSIQYDFGYKIMTASPKFF